MTLLVRDHPITFLALLTVFPLFQLRRTHASEGLFSRVVLVRVARLTIETNTLTGTYPLLGKPLNLTSC
jgi:hypothetical protein